MITESVGKRYKLEGWDQQLHFGVTCLFRCFVTQWTVAHQASLSMEILQARILEWVAMPSSTSVYKID